jgi:hypothetical protein
MSSPAAVWRPVVTEILRERVGAGESVWLPTRGCSMRPQLGAGARIFVTLPARVRFGDLLAYESEGMLVCHRVIGRRGAGWLARADHRGAGPEVVTRAQIVGIVAAFEQRGVTVDLSTHRQRALATCVAARSFAAAAWRYALQAVAGLGPRRPRRDSGRRYALQAVAGLGPRRPRRDSGFLLMRRRAWPRA